MEASRPMGNLTGKIVLWSPIDCGSKIFEQSPVMASARPVQSSVFPSVKCSRFFFIVPTFANPCF